MKRIILIIIALMMLCAVNAYSAQGTPTALAYEVKIYTQSTITINTKSGDLPKPVATYLPYMNFEYSGTGVTIITRVNGAIAKTVQTKVIPAYGITVISVKPIPTPTVTPTVTK